MKRFMDEVSAGIFRPYAYESLTTTSGAALGFTAAKYKNATSEFICARVVCTVETAGARYRVDGTAPTKAEGHLLAAGDVVTLIGDAAITNFNFISTTSTNSVIKATYEQ